MFVFGLNSPFVKVFERLSLELDLRGNGPGSVVCYQQSYNNHVYEEICLI